MPQTPADQRRARALLPVEQQLEAYNAGDLDRFVDAYSPDCLFDEISGRILRRGHAQMREHFGSRFADSPALHAEVDFARHYVGEAGEDYIVYAERITGRQGYPADEPWEVLAIYRVEQGKITRLTFVP